MKNPIIPLCTFTYSLYSNILNVFSSLFFGGLFDSAIGRSESTVSNSLLIGE
jgi:hypothetical protein